MFAIVESGSITSFPKGNKGVEINGIKHPASIFTLWSESERNAIGVYTVEMDNTNRKDTEWYQNTGITYTYDSSANKVKGTYGTATAKAHADTLYTNDDKTNNDIPSGKDVGDVKQEGLKTILIRQVKQKAESILNQTDWYVVRKADTSEAIPSAIDTHRAAVRSKQAEQETAITNAADTPALQALYTRNESGVRPLGDLPTLE
tara:strand:- start:212 stop:823 length:612 start_codon:yes stop_codon:yes gene_type:complete